MPKVIVFEQPQRDFDLTDLNRFGEIAVLYDPSSGHAPHPFRKKEFDRDVEATLAQIGYDVDKDYIALVGKTTKFMYLALYVTARYGRAKLLQYNATNGQYFVQRVGEDNGAPSRS